MFAPNIIIDITFYGFKAGQKLVRSRSNYFAHDGQRALSSITIELNRSHGTFSSHEVDGEHALTLASNQYLSFLNQWKEENAC